MAKWQDSYVVGQRVEFRVAGEAWWLGRVTRKTASGKLIVAVTSAITGTTHHYAADRKSEIRPAQAMPPAVRLAATADHTAVPDGPREMVVGNYCPRGNVDRAVADAYRDAARIVMEPRGGMDPQAHRHSVLGLADRLLSRAQGLAEPGKGRLPNEEMTDYQLWLAHGVEPR